MVESAGTSFFHHAVVRVLGEKGWGILTLENLDPDGPVEALIREALDLARITEDPVDLADAPRQILPVPAVGEDPRDVSLEEKTHLLAGIEGTARIPGIVNTRARYSETIEVVRFLDSSGVEFSYEVPRCG